MAIKGSSEFASPRPGIHHCDAALNDNPCVSYLTCDNTVFKEDAKSFARTLGAVPNVAALRTADLFRLISSEL